MKAEDLDNSRTKKFKWWIPVITATVGVVLNLAFSYSGLVSASDAYHRVAASQYSVSYPQGLFFYGIVGPLIEEILFRAICYNILKKMFGSRWAIFISALMFGIYHGNIVQGIYSFIMGVLIAVGYEYSRDFKIPVASHGLTNMIVFTITYFSSQII